MSLGAKKKERKKPKARQETDVPAPSAEGLQTLVLRRGLLPPHEGAAFVDQQMFLGHRLRNSHVEIECGRREALRQAERAVPGVVEAEARYAASLKGLGVALDALKGARAAARGRAETDEQKQALKDARAELRAAGKDLRVARRKARQDPAVVALREEIDGDKTAEHGEKGGRVGRAKRGARALAGVGWGVYARVEARADAARKAIDKPDPRRPGRDGLYDGLEPNDPRFVSWRGDSFVGAQQLTGGGITLAEITSGKDPRVRIEAGVSVRQVWDPRSRVHRSVLDARPPSGHNRVLRIRLGKGETATWCAWPMKMHEEIPKGTIIKEAVVHRRMCGPREEWYVTFTVAAPKEASTRVRAKDGAVALNLGWRKLACGSLRIGTWLGTDGERGEIRLSPEMLAALTKARGIRAVRDTEFDKVRDGLSAWMKENAALLPTWLSAPRILGDGRTAKAVSSNLHAWKSQARLQKLVLYWGEHRFAGDEEVFVVAEAWRYRDFHLWLYETGARTKALRRRKQHYRIAAKELAARYHTIILEDFDLRNVAVRPETGADDETGDDDASRAQRHLTAPSELRLCLMHAFAEVAQVPSKNTTRTCNVCGVVHPFDAKHNIWREPVCPECGSTWDQDENAGVNILRVWQERESGPPSGPRPAKAAGRSRFERARLAAVERSQEKARKAAEAAGAEAPDTSDAAED